MPPYLPARAALDRAAELLQALIVGAALAALLAASGVL